MHELMVWPCGTAVELGDGDIPGMITAIDIRGEDEQARAKYEVVWWDGRQRKCEWLDASEISIADRQGKERMKIGFLANAILAVLLLASSAHAAPPHFTVAIAEAEALAQHDARPALPNDFPDAARGSATTPESSSGNAPTLLPQPESGSPTQPTDGAESRGLLLEQAYEIQSRENRILELRTEVSGLLERNRDLEDSVRKLGARAIAAVDRDLAKARAARGELPELPPMKLEVRPAESTPSKSGPLTVVAYTGEDEYGKGWCINCPAAKQRFGDGNDQLTLGWSTFKAPGPQIYPAFRFIDSSSKLRFPADDAGNYRQPKDLDDLIAIVRRHQQPLAQQTQPAPIEAIGAAGTIHGRARLDQAKQFIRDNIGENVPMTFAWGRSGLQTFSLLKAGTEYSFETIFGKSGRIELSAKGSKLPVNAIGFSYRMEGGDLVLDADAVRLQGLADRLGTNKKSKDSIGAEPVGMDPMTILTILSVIKSVWELLHPTADLEFGGNVSAEAMLTGDVLTVTFKQAPKLRITMLWQWLLGVDKVTIGPDEVAVDFANQPGVMFPIKKRTFALVE